MLVVHVFVHIKPDAVEAFKELCIDNSRNSLQEPGCVRFDVVQQQDDPQRFVLVEAYEAAQDIQKHKETAHYVRWRDNVEAMQVESRYSHKYDVIHPAPDNW
ncbi:MAG: putative quinol monooxygenase [Verrucomicrobia bacterium]|nr:putative quinol monooxygenase [Verrucomicrobiota bacterium]